MPHKSSYTVSELSPLPQIAVAVGSSHEHLYKMIAAARFQPFSFSPIVHRHADAAKVQSFWECFAAQQSLDCCDLLCATTSAKASSSWAGVGASQEVVPCPRVSSRGQRVAIVW